MDTLQRNGLFTVCAISFAMCHHDHHLFVSLVAGIAIGHVYYFLEDVFPEQPGGFRILRTPKFM